MKEFTPEEKEQLQAMVDGQSVERGLQRRYHCLLRRLAANLIDWMILYLVLGILLMALLPMRRIYYLEFLLTWLYYAIMESSSKQATVGKMALGIVVTDLNGKRVSFGRATGRHFGKILSGLILGFGFIMAAFTEKGQALHDIIAGCLVLRT